VSETGPGHHRVEIVARLGDAETLFVLDTGAPTTTLVANEATGRYTAVRSSETKGVAGFATTCDRIVVDSIDLGGRRLSNFPASRCREKGARNLLGLDALGERFRIDLRRRSLTFDSPPAAAAKNELRRLRNGHLTVPARLGDVDVWALFDTGADTTVIDSTFVEAHPASFTRKRAEEGRDATGKAISSDVYEVSSIRIGSLDLKNVEVATFPFSEAMKRDMGPETPVIVGTNVIEPGAWTFDLRTNHWSIERH
jgi:predicted aspartyl protease